MLRIVSFDEILAGKYVGSATLSSFKINGIPVFVFGNRRCDGVSNVLSFRSCPKYTSGLELIIAFLLIPTNLS